MSDGKTQAFLRDRKAPTLRVRVTHDGVKSFVFEAKLDRQTIRRTIGDVRSWTRVNNCTQERAQPLSRVEYAATVSPSVHSKTNRNLAPCKHLTTVAKEATLSR